MQTLRVTYHLAVGGGAAAARAEEVAREQTVEVPRAVLRDAFLEEGVVGRVESLAPDADGGQRASIAYPVETTGFDPAQLLNVVFGNSSLHDDVRCLDVELPESLLAALGGPRFGIQGLRDALGVHDRPLTCTAVKPMGLSTRALADLCGSFARAGIDVIKDDHGLADQAWSRFEERVVACLEATRRAADASGRQSLYVPNLIGTPERLRRGLAFAQERGAGAVLVSPMLVGMPAFFELCRERSSVPVLAHPAFGGALRIAPRALFGKLFRLFGADAVIYVSFGSRFSQGRAECRELADTLLRPWGPLLPACPVPAGGIRLENVAEVVEFYGRDAMLLVGGDLQLDPAGVEERSRRFVETVADAARALRGAA
jgi:ribulose-bisphosphate carboxylase large chain